MKLRIVEVITNRENNFYIQEKGWFGWKDVKNKEGGMVFAKSFKSYNECEKYLLSNYSYDYYTKCANMYELNHYSFGL